MKFGGKHISMKKLVCAIKDIKEKKATDERGLIAEYLKALKDVSREEMRVLLNDVINGGCCCCCLPRPGPSSSQSRFPLSR